MTVPPVTSSMEITFTQLARIEVRTTEGVVLGRIVDVRLNELSAAPVVDLVMIGPRRGHRLTVAWEAVEVLGDVGGQLGGLLMSGDSNDCRLRRGDGAGEEGDSGSLFLRRDVLDSQVVDLSGSRLSRVSEVLLELSQEGVLTAVAVDLGLGSLLARMGLGSFGRHMKQVLVAWDDLYLASAGGHRVELSVSAERLRRLEAGTVAEVVARLRTEQAADVLRAVAPERAATALAKSHHQLRRRLLRSLPPDAAAAVLEAGPPELARDLAASE